MRSDHEETLEVEIARLGGLGLQELRQVLEKGFEYCDEQYGSLSQVARRITGSRWSGPAFFGLKRRRGVKA